MSRLPSLFIALIVLVAPLVVFRAGTAEAQRSDTVSVVASGLINPRGVAWDAGGTLIVAEAGTGGDNLADGEESVPPPIGPMSGGPTARVSRIADGCAEPLASGLPSYANEADQVGGVADVAVIEGNIYALVTGGGAAHGNPDQPNGLYRIETDGAASLVTNLTAWLQENPVAQPPPDYDPAGSFFDMIVLPDERSVLVVESNSQQVLRVTSDGEISRVADLSEDEQIPTAIAVDESGSIYVSYLSGLPYPDGAARVVKLSDDGAAEEVWTGLTTVTGLAVGSDGALYALEMSTGNTEEPPYLTRNSGRLVRQSGLDSAEPVVTGLDLPIHLAIGPDGAFYVSTPAVGADDGSGMVLRIESFSDEPVTVEGIAPLDACPEQSEDGSASETGVTIEIYDFGFSPDQIEIQVGTEVTWVNVGEVDHTTVAFDGPQRVWDSNIMHPGDRFTFTFEDAGSYEYLCGLHPDMKARIDVVP